MIEWRDEAVVLSRRPHGESAAIVDLFTRDHGRHAGVVRGGGGKRLAAVLQPGSQVIADWRARLDEQLGHFVIEPLRGRSHVFEDRLALAGLGAVCAMLVASLPERQADPALWQDSITLLDRLGAPDWPEAYLRWELGLLEALGFGLDLSRCAVTGARQGLAFVSPRSGRAVTWEGAGDWADRLMPLPAGLVPGALQRLDATELSQGLAISGHFLGREIGRMGGRDLPAARGRLLDLLIRAGGGR